MVSRCVASASVNQCGMRLRVCSSVTVCTYSWRSTSCQSNVPRCRAGAPSRGASSAMSGPVLAAMVWIHGMPVMRTAKLLWSGCSSITVGRPGT